MKTLTLAICIVLAAMIGRTAPITVITNYFTGYVAVTSGWATVSDSGLAAGTAYVCIPLSALPALTASNAVASGTGSDVRALLYAINDQAYTVYTATTATNRPANAEISKVSAVYSASELMIQHSLKTRLTLVTTSITPE